MRVGFNERKRLSKRGAVRRRGQYYNTCDGGSNVCLAVRVRCFLRAAYTQKSRYDEISAMIPWDGSCRLCKENVDGIDLDAFQVFQTISSIAARITAGITIFLQTEPGLTNYGVSIGQWTTECSHQETVLIRTEVLLEPVHRHSPICEPGGGFYNYRRIGTSSLLLPELNTGTT
ncbi:hypothetical protein M430DRAFT_18742 [Amorphotheca resinae ATCC 22711]|uniref:Uncharacterized protein n=1 Tax=Amorphotheca resinae ATCC 22711 TaxID=857342 RepID=A0A2T3B4N0_AMORE|nr:hypothetical protein M430DRAFT_18742 [Amorphotheca resinae ATCC 22711]PSS20590.1 hypothetical protein M430DRAFT_18742 [Amorphotheca resinae ATCC 22711]